jgi:hypothetical protein
MGSSTGACPFFFDEDDVAMFERYYFTTGAANKIREPSETRHKGQEHRQQQTKHSERPTTRHDYLNHTGDM